MQQVLKTASVLIALLFTELLDYALFSTQTALIGRHTFDVLLGDELPVLYYTMLPTQKLLDTSNKKQVVLVNNREIEIKEVRIAIFLG